MTWKVPPNRRVLRSPRGPKTLYAETEIVGKRPSRSRPGTGVVTFVHRGRNERDEAVCTATRAALVRCRDANASQVNEHSPAAR